jgi:hypothetical protein
MASVPNPSNIAWNQVNKAVTSATNKTTKAVRDSVIPKTPMDLALTVFPYGRAARMVGGITGKGARAVAKLYRNMGK